MICPQCGEDNSDNFRFCGMCGTLLEARPAAGASVPGLPKKIENPREQMRPLSAENTAHEAKPWVPAIGGPSVLGLGQPDANQSSSSPPSSRQSSPTQFSMNLMESESFPGAYSYLAPEPPKSGGRRILLLVALLAALGGAGWWTYSNYLGAIRKPAAGSSGAGETSADTTLTKQAASNGVPTDSASSQVAAQSGSASDAPSERAGAGSASRELPVKAAEEEKTAPVVKPVAPAVVAESGKRAAKTVKQRQVSATTVKPPILSAPPATDTGDTAFRKGEAYLYGRGVAENCDEAVKNLKAASAKSNAKARSAFGTMYATGHCVPRDLPTSYLWFALALQVDPNNQILEKDLSAIWNQMTPPERQTATRMKQ